jgi:AcrR family transcriptional regulator
MLYSTDQKQKARRSIIESGAKVLKRGGFSGVGVDQVAAAAGVTSGSLYSNFSGKEDLLKRSSASISVRRIPTRRRARTSIGMPALKIS